MNGINVRFIKGTSGHVSLKLFCYKCCNLMHSRLYFNTILVKYFLGIMIFALRGYVPWRTL